MRKTIFAGFAIAAATGIITGTADEAHATYSASIGDFAVYRNPDAPTTGDQVVALELTGKSWGITTAAKRLDSEVDGLTIVSGYSGTCEANPTAMCVKVVVGSYDDTAQRDLAGFDDNWRGLTTWDDQYDRTVYLNTSNTDMQDRRDIATHELGHAVGLDHDGHGRMSSTNSTEWFTKAELMALRQWYSSPRYRTA